MQHNWSFFRSKLARRIFFMFVACALLPIAALFVISLDQVTRQLDQQSQRRLTQAVKAHGVSVYERLLFLETDLKLVSSIVLNQDEFQLDADHLERLRRRFKRILLSPPASRPQPILGNVFAAPALAEDQWSHLQAGSTVIHSRPAGGRWPQLLMIRRLKPDGQRAVLLIAEIASEFLWTNWDQNALPSDIDFCVFDSRRQLLFSTRDIPPALAARLKAAAIEKSSRQTRIAAGRGILLTCHWIMFLRPKFLVPEWTVMVIQPESSVMGSMKQFRYLFVLVTVMTLLVVLLLSINMIRRSLTPLEQLKESTRRIAAKDFSAHLDIRSGDEFEELAEAFNNMTDQLNRQFNTLVAKSEIDRAILSSIETEKIVRSVLTGMRSCFSYDAISIVLLDVAGGGPAQIYTGTGSLNSEIKTTRMRLSTADLHGFVPRPAHLTVHSNQTLPAYLESMAPGAYATYLMLPIFLNEELRAIIAFGSHDPKPRSLEDIRLARQMTDQVAVALSNSQLMDELNRLNWGTIKALARAVDAKSSWTAGHSERVAEMAVSIGGAIQMAPVELENLKRAALLHDIGKLGVPVAILDKPGKLTADEYRMVQRHPSLGARILKPINAYAAIIPLVRHHHENFDGSGYPDGVAGSDIELGARILAVADVFDALKSDRPYRRGLPLEQVIDFMRSQAARQFDPQMVQVLMETLTRERTAGRPEPASAGFSRRAVRSKPKREVTPNEPKLPSSTPH